MRQPMSVCLSLSQLPYNPSIQYYLPACLLIYPRACVTCLSNCMPACLPVFMPAVCLPASLLACLAAYLSACFRAYLRFNLLVCMLACGMAPCIVYVHQRLI